jgi:hypothetical protein
LAGQRPSQRLEIGLTRHAPDHFAQGRPGFRGTRQRRIVGFANSHLAAVEAFEVEAGVILADQSESPVEEEALARRHILDAIGDAVDAFDVGDGHWSTA